MRRQGRNDEAWAVFWCSLLSSVLLEEIPAGRREAHFRKLAEQEHLLPNGRRQRISARTCRRWWNRLRDEGVQGLFRRPRSDRGKPRGPQARLLARAVELKLEQPRRSDQVINQILQHELGGQVPRSTLYRHLRREGATRRRLGLVQEKIRCRWTRDQSNALWVGDFEHGPIVMHQGQAVKTHLSAWIDCHSRYVVEACYYIRENLDILIDSLLRAWSHHGASRELYVDNAKIYHANALVLACTQLNVRLLHRPPRDPAAGGLIERFFQTLQGQFEAEVRATTRLTLPDLNRDLQAWLDVAYHRRIHSQTGQPPAERFQAACRFQRNVDVAAIQDVFCRREQRTVHLDFSDVQIDNHWFAVDPRLRGERVVVKFDPFQTDDRLQEVQLFDLEGAYRGVGKRYLRQKGFHEQPSPAAPTVPANDAYLQALRAEQARIQQEQRERGIDYASARQRNEWPFTRFANRLAKLLGRAAGISAFSAEELTVLGEFHARHGTIHEGFLRQAIEQAASNSLPRILFQLQFLLQQRNA